MEGLDEFVAGRPDSRLGSIVHTKFVENVNYMTFDCMRTDGKLFGITIELHYIWRRDYKQGNKKMC